MQKEERKAEREAKREETRLRPIEPAKMGRGEDGGGSAHRVPTSTRRS
jgi:hypothetical protein